MGAWRKIWCADSAYYNYLGKFISNSKLIRTLSYPSHKHCCLSKRYVLLNYTDGLIWHNAIREKSAKERKIERVSKERDHIRRIEYFPAIYPYFGSGFIPSLCVVTYKGNSIADCGRPFSLQFYCMFTIFTASLSLCFCYCYFIFWMVAICYKHKRNADTSGVGSGGGTWRDFFSNKFVMDNMLNIILVMMVFHLQHILSDQKTT